MQVLSMTGRAGLTRTLAGGLCEDHRPQLDFLNILNFIFKPINEIKIFEKQFLVSKNSTFLVGKVK